MDEDPETPTFGEGFSLALEEERTWRSSPPFETAFDAGEIRWILPGHGAALPTCGRVGYRGHLANGSVHFAAVRLNCARFACPTCDGWMRREARAIEDRVLAGSPIHRPPVHIAISPRPDSPIGTIGDYRLLRREAYRVARSRGFEGGCLVFHPVRIAKPGGRDRCEPGPHFHAIGTGVKRDVAPRFRDDGWVVKFLGSRKRVFRTALYVLSHAGQARPCRAAPALEGPVRDRSPLETVTWFGSMSYLSLRRPRVAPEGILCAVCGLAVPLKRWFDLVWVGDGPPRQEAGECDPLEWRAEVLDRTAGWRGVRVPVDLGEISASRFAIETFDLVSHPGEFFFEFGGEFRPYGWSEPFSVWKRRGEGG